MNDENNTGSNVGVQVIKGVQDGLKVLIDVAEEFQPHRKAHHIEGLEQDVAKLLANHSLLSVLEVLRNAAETYSDAMPDHMEPTDEAMVLCLRTRRFAQRIDSALNTLR